MNTDNYGLMGFCMACFAFVVAMGAWTKVQQLEAKLKKERSDSADAANPEVIARRKKLSSVGMAIGFVIAISVFVVALVKAHSK
jgi:hypothetical protein